MREVRKQACSAQLPQLGYVPTHRKNTPLGGCWNNQTSQFIHAAYRHDTPGARDVRIMNTEVLNKHVFLPLGMGTRDARLFM